MILEIMGVLVALPGAVLATLEVIDRLRKDRNDDPDEVEDESEE